MFRDFVYLGNYFGWCNNTKYMQKNYNKTFSLVSINQLLDIKCGKYSCNNMKKYVLIYIMV